MDILINYNVSENVVAFITELMKSKPVDRMTDYGFTSFVGLSSGFSASSWRS